MYAVNSTQWIYHNLYNQFPDVKDARNLIGEEDQKVKARELTELIPEIARRVGIGIPHRHWLLKENENIIGQVKESSLYSRRQYNTEIACPTAWVPTKEGLSAIEGIINPSTEVSEIAKKVNESAEKIRNLFLLSKEEEFSKFSVAIDPGTITDVKSSYFLETNVDGTSILNPITKEKIGSSAKDTILTYIRIEPDEKGITKVACESLCLELGGGHGNVHAYSDPSPTGWTI